MAEQKQKPQAEKEPGPAPPPLGAAGESSDPRVQQLIAELATAVSNGDEAAADALSRQLADLGVR